jgi:hypothetical protein
VTFPTLNSTASTIQASATTHPVTIPAGSVGDLLVIVFTVAGSATINADHSAGWTQYYTGATFDTGTSGERVAVYFRFADNTNDAFSVTSTAAVNSNAVAYRFAGASHFTLSGRHSGGNGTNVADSPQASVESYGGVQNQLILAVRVIDGATAPTAVPSGFTAAGDSINSTLSRIDWATANINTAEYSGGAWTSASGRFLTLSFCISPTVPASWTYEYNLDDEPFGPYVALESLGLLTDSLRLEASIAADPSLVKYKGLRFRVVSNGPGGAYTTVPRTALRFNTASRIQVRSVFRLADTWDLTQIYINPISNPYDTGFGDTGIFFDGQNRQLRLYAALADRGLLLGSLQNSNVINLRFELENQQTVRGKAWLMGTPEPLAWTVEYTHTGSLNINDLGFHVRLDNNGNDNWFALSYTSYGFNANAPDPVVEILPATISSTTGSPSITSNVSFAGSTGNAIQWTSNGTVTFATPGYVYYLAVGGGGGGGASGFWYGSGGGGGGGLLQGVIPVQANVPYDVIVGAGGAAPNGTTTTTGGVGGNTSFNSIVAFGGGGGAGSVSATTGGSGGGGGSNGTGIFNGAANIDGQGFDGGDGFGNANNTIRVGGGGGGAGGLGGDSNTVLGIAGAGGIGFQSSITGVSTYYAGGGGGGSTYSSLGGLGGLGGGGNGEVSGRAKSAGVNGLGGGGGGEAVTNSDPGVPGGSGTLVLYVLDLPAEIVYASNNATVTSGAYYNNRFGTLYQFNTSGDITFSGSGTVHYLVVGGGGSGGGGFGSQPGGGGGGGQVKTGTMSVSSGKYYVRVGAGGTAAGDLLNGNAGAPSDIVAFNVSQIGGAAAGGLGGRTGAGSETGGGGASGNGNAGGTGGSYLTAGGGGGSTSAGVNGLDSKAGNGGAGVTSDISGTMLGYGGGGGGGAYQASVGMGLGVDGGGNGGQGDNPGRANVIAPTAGVRGGGGGGAGISVSAAGGAGTVLLFVEEPVSGGIKVWLGSDWAIKPVKFWNNTTWIVKPLKFWDNNSWRTTP